MSLPKLLRKSLLWGVVALNWQWAHAYDVGPFTINGFAKIEASRASNQCANCQLFPLEDRNRPWADSLAAGVPYGTTGGHLSLIQPYLGTREFDLGGGFKVKGLLSQRWRDGRVDIQGVWYEKNLTLRHEDYGMLQFGAFPTRGWAVADYPYGTILGIADPWGASGAGYGLLTRAVRYGAPLQDVAGGDLYLEFTVDAGDSSWQTQRPRFMEAYAKYVRGPLMLDFIAQSAKNGQAMAWGHGPFIGASTSAPYLGNTVPANDQSILMVMGRYQFDAKTDLYAGIRHNRWSGARGVITGLTADSDYTWANMFNVNTGDLTKAYPASSTDISLGVVYRFMPQWSARVGLVHLGKASTSNPTERGQSNSMVLGSVGVGYDVTPDLTVYGFAGMVNFARKGLGPLSMPSNTAFTGVDPRVATNGNWAGVGLVLKF